MRACPICAGESRRLRAWSHRPNEEIALHRCAACRCEFTAPQPSDERLAEAYANYPRARSAGSASKVAFFRRLLSSTALEFTGTALEIGGAEGACAKAFSDLWPGTRLTVLEPGAADRALYTGLDVILDERSIEEWLGHDDGAFFDTILAFDVLEHLRDPLATLTRLVECHMKSGGHIVASFPNVSSLSRRILGRHWMQYKAEHLVYFSGTGVNELARRVGLETVRLEPLSKRLSIEYFLGVGSHTGPESIRAASRVLGSALPGWLARTTLSLPVGEWLWIARRAGE